MNNNKTKNIQGGAPQGEPVRVGFTHPTASTLGVAGTFNDWRPEVAPMITLGNGSRRKPICKRPAADRSRTIQPQANQRRPGEPEKSPKGSTRMKQKVLLVDDDNESLLHSLRHSLSSETYEVVLAENVQHAIAKSEAGEIDLLLMNLDSPTQQAWEAIAEITKENPFLPVIVITGQSELRELAEAAGARALVKVPVDGPMLLQTIRELLAEPVQNRMSRAYNQEIDFRHVPPGTGDFRDLLHRRYTTPFRYAVPQSHWGINE
jgi:CheY-like chemotaxis protein